MPDRRVRYAAKHTGSCQCCPASQPQTLFQHCPVGWCRQVVAAEVAAFPQAVGFPAILVVMKETGGFGKTIARDEVPEAGYEVFWP